MTINLRPEDERLIQKQLQSGVFASAEEVIHRALESLEADENWLQENRKTIDEKIERGFAQFERGEGLTSAESRARLETKKSLWRADQRRA